MEYEPRAVVKKSICKEGKKLPMGREERREHLGGVFGASRRAEEAKKEAVPHDALISRPW